MSVPVRLALFTALLIAAFGAAAVVGGAVASERSDGDALAFEVDAPSPGTYRHYVQYQLRGRVHTAAFTEEVTR